MNVGDLVRHVEWEYIGIATKQGDFFGELWLIHFSKGFSPRWCSDCELEVLCK